MSKNGNTDIQRLLTRFYEFFDGVLRSIQIEYGEDGKRKVELTVACRDAESSVNDGWVQVRIVVHNVKDFTIREQKKTTLQVLSQGIHFQNFEDCIGIEFGGLLEPPQTISELQRSDGFVIGETFQVLVELY